MQITSSERQDAEVLKAKYRQCAAELMEVLPGLGRFVGGAMRRKSNLSMAQLKVLYFISRNPGTSLSQAADDLSVTRASASDLIDRLVKRGYVCRVEDPQERRKVLLSLTTQGQLSLDEASQFAQASLTDKLEGIELASIDRVIAGLQPLKNAFTEV